MGIFAMADNTNTQLTDLLEKLPGTIDGWKKSAKSAVYGPDNLFKYINGGAELYISYRFKQLAARTYHKEKLPEIKIDIFDMGHSHHAFGVFSHSRETLDTFVAPGVESEYAAGLLTFWKGRFYVSILAYPETAEKRAIVKKLAGDIAARITGENSKPPVVSKLPRPGLIPESVRYFQHYIWLNSHYYVSDKNILGIDHHTGAVLAKFSYKKGNDIGEYLLLLVSYPDNAKARAGADGFFKHFLPDASDGFKKLEDSKWCGCIIDGSLVGIVFNAPTLDKAKEVLNGIK